MKIKDRILSILKSFTREMEGYSYFGSNPGIQEDDYNEIADKIISDTITLNDTNAKIAIQWNEEKQEHINLLADEIELLKKENADLESMKSLLKDICDEWNEDCNPTCDRYGHDENCKKTNIAEAKKALRLEIESLKKENIEIKQLVIYLADRLLYMDNKYLEDNLDLIEKSDRYR